MPKVALAAADVVGYRKGGLGNICAELVSEGYCLLPAWLASARSSPSKLSDESNCDMNG